VNYTNIDTSGVVVVDQIDFKMKANFSLPSKINHGFFDNYSVYELNNTGYETMNDQCRVYTGYENPFGYWLPEAKYTGEIIIDGLLCQIYKYTYNYYEIMTNTLYANGTIPVQITEFSYSSYSDLNKSSTTTFYNLQPSISKDDFVPPKTCHGDDYVCPGGNITEMEFYRFHPPAGVTLDNRNAADALGDVTYVCSSGPDGQDKHISIFKAKVNTSWGQYQFCNFEICDGFVDVPTVGHESSYGASFDGGQCSKNVGIGNWYSFNSSFKCASESNFHDCAWYQTGIGKTIDVTCLDKLGFFYACETDGGDPYPTALKIWNNAFKYNKTSNGGCPHIVPLADPASYESPLAAPASDKHELWRQKKEPKLLPYGMRLFRLPFDNR